MLILPFVSIVQEKVRSLSQFAVDLNFHIEEYAGDRGAMPPLERRGEKRSIFIATIEKAHSLINSLIETQRLSEMGLIVIDELHLLGDKSHRATALEALICKVKLVDSTIKFIGMSATLGKMDILEKFLNASIYASDFRPVKLEEFIKIDNMILRYENGHLTPVKELNYEPASQRGGDPDNICNLVRDVIPDHSCLIFCPTKKHCENVAQLLAKSLPTDLEEVHKEGKKILLERLITEVGSTCVIMQHAILYGVAYHHSGLAAEERRLLEEAYLEGILCVLICTSTLAAGVNLPARRVILRAPYIGGDFISLSTYKQMVGRAGRAGLQNSIGESYLIVQKEDKDKFSNENQLQRTKSERQGIPKDACTKPNCSIGIATTEERVESALQQTMFAILQGRIVTKEQTQNTLDYLKSNNYVYENPEQGASLHLSPFGEAVVEGHMDVSQAKDIYEEVQQNLRILNVQTHLHLLFLLTPRDNQEIVVVPEIYLKEYVTLSPADRQVAEAIGASEKFVFDVLMGREPQNSAVVRFYQTLIPYALCRKESIPSVAARFQLQLGTVQSLLSTATTYGSSLGKFCQAIESLWAYQDLLPRCVSMLASCADVELPPLLKLPSVRKARARQLFNAGYKTLDDIATSTPTRLRHNVKYLSSKEASQIIAEAKMRSALINGLDGI
ncbi:HELQ [Cordylochernes scorpioides]|uniref:HELQ n=1 Tax=Cordylochernes scorpioides TaxID=51811 RepID=A0ABY6LMY4_9ARAC|nr:HELQ [Cordylochernes scorpioides]